MKILLTGASSFTGMWFAKSLRVAGHDVIATLQSDLRSYSSTRAIRIELLQKIGVKLNCLEIDIWL